MRSSNRIITMKPRSVMREAAGKVVAAQLGYDSAPFQSIYIQRNIGVAPPLNNRFDARAQEIYAGLDTKRFFLPAEQRNYYSQVFAEELNEVADALLEHSSHSLTMIRRAFQLPGIEWLGLVNRDGLAQIQGGVVVDREELRRERDGLDFIRHIPQTDAAMVGPRQPGDNPITLAMYVADCLAIPIVDTRTHAFAFVHAGRPCTGLRLAEKTVIALGETFGSDPADLTAYLGEGVCQYCYQVDEETYRGFVNDFGGESEVANVLKRHPEAVCRFEFGEERNVGIDLYAFNAYLLAQAGVSQIVLATNCTARLNPRCISLRGSVPAESAQQFYSHVRTKNRLVGWRRADGQTLELNTYHLTTPRNWTSVTRL